MKTRSGAAAQERRTRILQAAENLFQRYGYQKTSTAEIAAAAGVGKATLYQYFTDKTHLLGEVYNRKSLQLLDLLKAGTAAEYATVDKLLAMLRIMRDFYTSDPLLSQFIKERKVSDLEMLPHFAMAEGRNIALIREILEEGIKKGEIRPFSVEIAATFLFRVSIFLNVDSSDFLERFPGGQVMAFFRDFLVGGITAR